MAHLLDFAIESNHIEGIVGATTTDLDALTSLLEADELTIPVVHQYVSSVQPNAVLRDRHGLDVRVGKYYPPIGSPKIAKVLEGLLVHANYTRGNHREAYEVHQAYESLHPFTDGNGRSGRAIWLWMLNANSPRGFLHEWYYMSLAYSPKRSVKPTLANYLGEYGDSHET